MTTHAAFEWVRESRPITTLGQGMTGNAASQGAQPWDVLKFRRFDVLPGERMLLRDGRQVEIGSRAFDLLVILLKSRGALVTKHEIVSHVWPSTVVGESNLRFQMGSLRKVLGEDRDVIKTIPGRGYQLVAEVAQLRPATTPAQPARMAGRLDRYQDGPPLVVVIDDDDATREALIGLVRSVGWRVEAFASVQAFLGRSPLSTPHCLVLDVWMPGRSGLDFQADLCHAGLGVPVIFISGNADVPMSVRAMKAGAVEFLTKPVRHEELLGAIQRSVGSGNQTA